jgi:hypothetical protein
MTEIQPSEPIACKNCEFVYQGNFCPNCGQKSSTKRLNMHDIQHDVIHQFSHLDRGFFHTFKQLLTQPGQTIRDYIEGKRMRYYSPFGYILLLGTLCTFVYSRYWNLLFTPEMVDGMIKSLVNSLDEGQLRKVYEGPEFKKSINDTLNKSFGSYTYQMFLQVPIYAFFSSRFYRNGKYNFVECMVANMYIIAQNQFYALICFVPVIFLIKYSNWWLLVSTIVPMVMMCVSYVKFFQEKKLSKGIANYFLVFITVTISIGVVSFLIGIFSTIASKVSEMIFH